MATWLHGYLHGYMATWLHGYMATCNPHKHVTPTTKGTPQFTWPAAGRRVDLGIEAEIGKLSGGPKGAHSPLQPAVAVESLALAVVVARSGVDREVLRPGARWVQVHAWEAG